MGADVTDAVAAKQLDRARLICLALPGATEKVAWGAPTFRAPDKLFAMFADRHHGDARVALWCHAPQGSQQVLCHAQPDRYFVPPYVGVKGWVGIDLARVGDAELRERVIEAYRMVAKKTLLKELESGEEAQLAKTERRRKA